MKKLLFVVNNPDFFLSHRLPIGRAAKDAGYDVHVATPPGPSVPVLEKEGFTFHPVSLSRRGMNPLRELRALFALHRLYRSLRPDIVHHVTIKPVLYGGLAARSAGVPAVVSAVSGFGYVFLSRGLIASALRALVRFFYRVALKHPRSAVIFQNPDDREDFLRWGLVDASKTEIIRGSGVDTSLFAPQPEPIGPPVVVLPARLLWDKGIGEFVEAARLIRQEGFSARFVLVGSLDPGNPAAIPQETVEGWVREGVIEWWGYRDDMPRVFAASHIACLPSYREGLPKALIEAAAMSRPIVTTDVPGCREIVKDGVNGFLVPVRDAVSLAEALRKLLSDTVLRASFGCAGRAAVEVDLSVEVVVKKTLALYDRLVA